MGTIINEHNFTDSQSTDFEFEGFFAHYDKIRQPKHERYHAFSDLINKIKSKISVKQQSQHKEDESEWHL